MRVASTKACARLHFVFLLWIAPGILPMQCPVLAEEPAHPAPAVTNRAWVQEHESLKKESESLRQAGKRAQAIAVAERMLKLEREHFGFPDAQVADSLEYVAGLYEDEQDFAAAIRAP